jgi:hypothetical protein
MTSDPRRLIEEADPSVSRPFGDADRRAGCGPGMVRISRAAAKPNRIGK